MISPFHGKLPPYKLPSDIIYFHDWRYVNFGSYGWVDADNKGYALFGLDPVPPLRYIWHDIPHGVELEAKPAQKHQPFLTPEQTDEIFLFAGNVLLHDDGRYRLFYDCWPKEHIQSPDMGNCNYMRYAESDNGLDWRFPSLGHYERNGSKANNCVYGPPVCGERGYHGGCVFKDPSAPSAERYKAFYLGHGPKPDQREAFLRVRPNDVDPSGDWALYGAVSPDGLYFTPIPEPLVLVNSDTQNCCEYDPVLGRYVAYVRSWFFYRRSIGRMETTDFRRFPVHEEVFWPGLSKRPSDLWYTSGKTKMPGTVDYHLMFPMRWAVSEDKFDFYLASSPDNVIWNMVSDGPVCTTGDPGDWDGGIVGPGNGLVNLPGDRTGLLITGSKVPHKHPRRPPLGAISWATWPKGRLVALKAREEGSFATLPIIFTGRTVRLNFKTAMTGYVKVEVVGPENGKVLPGRSFDDCDHLCGNHLDQTVTWKGESTLNLPDGAQAVLRFKLRSAELYSVEFK